MRLCNSQIIPTSSGVYQNKAFYWTPWFVWYAFQERVTSSFNQTVCLFVRTPLYVYTRTCLKPSSICSVCNRACARLMPPPPPDEFVHELRSRPSGQQVSINEMLQRQNMKHLRSMYGRCINVSPPIVFVLLEPPHEMREELHC